MQNIELFNTSDTNEDVNILVGVNGSGKSTYLNEIGAFHLSKGKKVIAIANTIYDKFDLRGNKSKVLRSSKGRNIAKNSIKEILKIIERQDSKSFFNLCKVFDYLNLQQEIEFKINNLNPDFRNILGNSNIFSNDDKEELLYLLNRTNLESISYGNTSLKMSLNYSNFSDLRNIAILKILNFENKLKKEKIIKNVEIYLYKKNSSFPLQSASSGELTLITTLFYLSVYIDKDTVILIDEPENSLHPKWQIEYVKKIMDLFYLYSPKFVIATHSPMIINGAVLNINNLNIFKGTGSNKFEKQESNIKNVEKIYDDYFDVSTPENRYLSQQIIKNFNLLSSNKLSYTAFHNIIQELQSNSYDEIQKQAFDGILELAKNYR